LHFCVPPHAHAHAQAHTSKNVSFTELDLTAYKAQYWLNPNEARAHTHTTHKRTHSP
jgi:hypothetical protein